MDPDWDCDKRTCDVSVQGHGMEQLKKLQHTMRRTQHAPSKFTPPKHGQKVQMAKEESEATLTPTEIKRLQKVIGAFLWCGRVTDSTMLHALNDLASQQTKGNNETTEAMEHFLDHCATHPTATVRFQASDMILKTHSDASYLSETEARS